VVNTAVGFGSMLMHPITTAQNVAYAVCNLPETAAAAKNAVASKLESGSEGQGEIASYVVQAIFGPAAVARVVKGAATAAGLGRAAELTGEAAQAVKAAEGAAIVAEDAAQGATAATAGAADGIAETSAASGAASSNAAQLGQKLEYVFGKATGSAHNIERSQAMLAQLERIGLPDTAANRALLQQHLEAVANDASNIARTQANGRVVRESLLIGPGGAVKVESIWEGLKLITVNLFGGGG